MSGSKTPDPSGSSEETSYLEMSRAKNPNGSGSGADPFLVGQHCQLEYCNQLDFLPSKCQSCNKIFCLDHRTEDSHKCANAGAWAERRRKALANAPSIGGHKQVRDRHVIPVGSTCAGTDCATEIGKSVNTGVHCDACRQNYCLKHRLREEHECDARVAELKKARDKLGVENAMETFKTRWAAWVAKQKENNNKAKGGIGGFFQKTKRTSAAAERIKRINEIKQKSKGDQKLAADKRVYLVVAAGEANPKGKYPKEMLFYSKDWVVGRLLDAAAKNMQIENVNNQSSNGNDKLHVFHVEGEKVLGFSDKIGQVLQNGDRVVLTRGGMPPDEVIATLLA